MGDDEFEGILKAVMKASFAVFAFMFLARLFGYAFSILVAKSFSEEVYGAFGLLWSVVTLSTSILLLSIPAGVARFVPYYSGTGEGGKSADAFKTGLVMMIGIVAAASVLIYAILTVYSDFFSAGPLTKVVTVLAFTGFAFFIFIQQALIGFKKPEVSSILDFAGKAVALAGLAVIVGWRWGLDGILISLAAAYIISSVIGLVYCIRNKNAGGRFNKEIARLLLSFGLPLMLSNITYGVLTWADVFIMRAFRTLAEVGIYQAALLLSNAGMLFFGVIVTMVYEPMMTECFGQKRLNQMSRLSSYMLESFFMLFTPVFLVFLAFPREILVLFFKGEYGKGAAAFQILAVAMFFYGMIQVFRSMLRSVGKPQLEVKVAIAAAVVNVALNLALIKPYGMIGAAFSALVANAIILAATYYYSTRMVRLHYAKRRIIKIAAACTLSLALTSQAKVLVGNPLTSLIASGLALVCSYAVVLYALKSFRREDVFAVDAVLRKIKSPEKSRKLVVGLLERGVTSYN